jgi:hypothetical protein
VSPVPKRLLIGGALTAEREAALAVLRPPMLAVPRPIWIARRHE